MRNLRKPALVAALAAGVFGVAQSATADPNVSHRYIVVYEQGSSTQQAHRAVEAAGGTIVDENAKIGVATVRSSDESFARDAGASGAIVGAAIDKPVGRAPKDAMSPWERIEKFGWDARGHRPRSNPAPADEPLAGAQWDMRMIGATPEGSYRRQPGTKAVRVGILDTGVDASHPDIAPNFDHALSRNFTVDDPTIDGPCEEEPDQSCEDPADIDEGGHGTHVAGSIGAALNGIGIAGVAPDVDIVNLRAGQDSGYFFLGPTLDALTYAGDHGIDVVNMSYYIDPWLYNCAANPADSPEEQRFQRLVVTATNRALDYARERGVTLVAAEGNGHTDLGDPKVDDTSPDYPVDPETGDPADARHRDIDNSCLSMPTEGNGVIGVTSVGPSTRKAYYSDYGLEQADVSAPGGDFYDPALPKPQGEILSTFPANVAREEGLIDENGDPTSSSIVRQDVDGQPAYWVYLQGTSMASPHTVGVVALIVSEYGRRDRRNGGLTMDPGKVERVLRSTATDHACPDGGLQRYDLDQNGTITSSSPNEAQFDATCVGTPERNGFYGDGIVNALAAVSLRGGHGDDHGHHHGHGHRRGGRGHH